MKRRRDAVRYLLCVRNDSYVVSLQLRRLYEQVPDEGARKMGLVRVIDESGDSYLYPRDLFADVDLPAQVLHAIAS